MKKVKIVFVLIILISFSMNGQGSPKQALGLRLGDNDGFGGEVSYQRKLNNNNRLELNLGYRNQNGYDAYKLSGIYQWIWKIDGGFNWYAGYGAGIGSWNDTRFDSNSNDSLFINADGNIGIEYNFDIPLLLSLDFRPEIGIIGNYGSNTNLDIALSLRYRF
jgi:hypothetical protein